MRLIANPDLVAAVEEEDVEDFLDRAREHRAEELLASLDDIPSEDWEARSSLFGQLPPIERAVLELRRRGSSYADIADALGMSKGGVLWRVDRARRRLRVLVRLPDIDSPTVAWRLLRAGVDPTDAVIVAHWWATSSQTRTARALRRGQTYVRARVIAVCAHIEQRDAALWRALEDLRRESRTEHGREPLRVRAEARTVVGGAFETPGGNRNSRGSEGRGVEKRRIADLPEKR